MAHRTKETPAGLQYENTAPNDYFRQLLELFESRMCLYRKLIADTEGYITGAQHGASVSPRGLCSSHAHPPPPSIIRILMSPSIFRSVHLLEAPSGDIHSIGCSTS